MALSLLQSNLDLTDPIGMAAAVAPELFLTGASLIVLLFIAWRHKTAADTRWAGWLSLVSLMMITPE